MNGLGDRVRSCRLELGMTQERLSGFCVMNRTTLVNIESGRHLPSLEALCRLSVALGVSTDYLLGLEVSS